ncbi:hypothetical protein FKM82_019848 [Ascaphus truei]
MGTNTSKNLGGKPEFIKYKTNKKTKKNKNVGQVTLCRRKPGQSPKEFVVQIVGDYYVDPFVDNLSGWTEAMGSTSPFPRDGAFDDFHMLMLRGTCLGDPDWLWFGPNPKWNMKYMRESANAWVKIAPYGCEMSPDKIVSSAPPPPYISSLYTSLSQEPFSDEDVLLAITPRVDPSPTVSRSETPPPPSGSGTQQIFSTSVSEGTRAKIQAAQQLAASKTGLTELVSPQKSSDKSWAMSSPRGTSTHPFKPGDTVLVKQLFKNKTLDPPFGKPTTIIAVTCTAILTEDSPTWIHASRVKTAPIGSRGPPILDLSASS